MLVALIPVCVWLQDNGVQDDDQELGVYHCSIISRTYIVIGPGYPIQVESPDFCHFSGLVFLAQFNLNYLVPRYHP